jgi:type IV pilus assembly protein PilM
MKFNFLSKTLPSIGLDVSGNSLKVVQLEQKTKQLRLKSFHEALLPKGLIINDAIVDTKTFDFLLKQSLDKPGYGRFDTSHVIASLPESKSFVRVIQIPQMSDGEANNAVPFEAESFIPLPIDQVYLDWQKIPGQAGNQTGLGASAEPGKMNILMIASPKEFVDRYLEILDKTGLKVVALEVESQSCLRAAIGTGSRETSLLVELGGLRSSLIMVEEGNLQFTSTIPIAGNTFTESIARALGVSSSKAEEIKKKVGITNTAEYPNIKTELLPVLYNLAAEIKNILKFHGEHSSNQVARVIIAGGSARLKNLSEFLANQLFEAGVPKVDLANPIQNLNITNTEHLDPLESLSFTAAIGLAARGVDYKAD